MLYQSTAISIVVIESNMDIYNIFIREQGPCMHAPVNLEMSTVS